MPGGEGTDVSFGEPLAVSLIPTLCPSLSQSGLWFGSQVAL